MHSIPTPETNYLVEVSKGENLKPLPVLFTGKSSISIWRLTDEDIKKISESRSLSVILGTKPEDHPVLGVVPGNFIEDHINKQKIITG